MTPMPMFHIGGIGWAFLGLWNGATTCSSASSSPRRPRRARAAARHERRARADDAPDAARGAGRGEARLLRLRSIAYGASPITTPVLKAALRTFRCHSSASTA
jgi:long-chain acyl-CoA synthetase